MIRLNLPAPPAPRPASRPRRRSPAAALANRLTADWVMQPVSADAGIRWSLRALRARSRQFVLDNEYATRFVHLMAENVIGQHGIEAQPANMLGDRFNTELNKRLKAAWLEWGEPETCTMDGRQSWPGLQQLIARAWPADGEVFIQLVPTDNKFGFALRLLDPDLCDDTLERARGPQQNAIRMGVELDEWERPVAYWCWSHHPQDYTIPMDQARVRIPASQMVHLFTQYRPGQTRGYPAFTPVLFKGQMLNGYAEAHVVATRMGAAAMGFLETDPAAVDPPAGDENMPAPVLEAEPGTFPELPYGKKLVDWTPNFPQTSFAEFMAAGLGAFSAGLNTSYGSLTGDLSSANYSSMRVGSLQERDGYQILQQYLATHLHRRVYRAWLNQALLTGAVAGPSRNASALWACWWQARGWPWVDPQSDLDAAETEIRLGLKSRTTICMERGQDFGEVAKELAEEQALADKLGIDITATVRPKPATVQGATNDTARHARPLAGR